MTEAKVEIDHGGFLKMIEEGLPFSADTAQALMISAMRSASAPLPSSPANVHAAGWAVPPGLNEGLLGLVRIAPRARNVNLRRRTQYWAGDRANAV